MKKPKVPIKYPTNNDCGDNENAYQYFIKQYCRKLKKRKIQKSLCCQTMITGYMNIHILKMLTVECISYFNGAKTFAWILKEEMLQY